MERAEKLTFLLQEEGERWVITVAELKQIINNIIGDVFLSSASVAYLGPFTGPYRQRTLQSWQQQVADLMIPLSSDFAV